MLAPDKPVEQVAPTAAEPEIAAPPIRRRRLYSVGFWLAAGWLGLVLGGALLANLLPLPSPTFVAPFNRLHPIGSAGHLLGTDDLGRDILARLVFGARVSMTVSVVSVAVGVGIGVPAGMLAAYTRGRVDSVIMFIVDVILSFPALVIVLALVAFIGQSLTVVALVLGFLAIPAYTRIARANTLAFASRDFVLAARAVGARGSRILVHEIFPNLVPPLLAYALIAMGVVIVIEGSLSFLGLSVQAPIPSWGGLIAAGQHYLDEAPHMVLIPSLAMLCTVLALNYLGDTVRKAYDVREARL